MALFKISKGLKNNLPSSKTDGWCYFTTDDGKFWIDYKDTDNALKRKAVNAAYADSATKATSDGSGNNIVNTYATKAALNGKADAGQKTTNSAGGHSHSLTIPVASITTEGTAASYTGHSFTAGSGSFTASVDANGVLSFSHTHTAPTHSTGTFSANKPTKISITNTNYTTNSVEGHTHSITI